MKKRGQRRITRRAFVGHALTAAGVAAGAPALLRGRNLNNKLDIAFIACGGRGKANIAELTMAPGRGIAAAPHPDENVTVLCAPQVPPPSVAPLPALPSESQ